MSEGLTSYRFMEKCTPGIDSLVDVKSLLYAEQTEFQHIGIMESPFGRHLTCDGYTQSTQMDEHIYHEALIHPAMISHPNPRRVFIGGGGELATAREILRHKSVEEVIMIDIDPKIVKACDKYLPSYSAGVLDDPRLTVQFTDCRKFLLEWDVEEKGPIDVVVMDICDPVEGGAGNACYFVDFYQQLSRVMSPGGVFVTQAGPAGFDTHDQYFSVIYNTMKEGFGSAVPFSMTIPSFSGRWGFMLGFVNEVPDFMDVMKPGAAEAVDALVTERLGEGVMKFYDGISHIHMFALPTFLTKALAEETRIMSADNQCFIFQ